MNALTLFPVIQVMITDDEEAYVGHFSLVLFQCGKCGKAKLRRGWAKRCTKLSRTVKKYHKLMLRSQTTIRLRCDE